MKKNNKERFSSSIYHCITTFSRKKQLYDLIDQLLKFVASDKIIVFDSGNRSDIAEYCSQLNIGYKSDVSVKTADQNIAMVFREQKTPMFVHHDDDEILPEIINVKKFLQENANIDFLCSLRFKDSKFNLSNCKNELEKINSILDMYFFSHNKNCPLISGLFVDNSKPWSFREKFKCKGEHNDVGSMLDLMTRKNSYISNNPYINYNTIGGHNSSPHEQGRQELAKYLRKISPQKGNLYSLICLFNFKRPSFYYFRVMYELIKYPSYFLKLLKKIFTQKKFRFFLQ